MVHRVTAKRWDRGWELHIDGVGVTQCKNVKDAEATIRDYLDLENLDTTAQLTITYQVGDGLDIEVADARRATIAAQTQQEAAAKQQRQVAAKLRNRGLRGTEVAAVLGVSEQRVSQLLKGERRVNPGPALSVRLRNGVARTVAAQPNPQ